MFETINFYGNSETNVTNCTYTGCLFTYNRYPNMHDIVQNSIKIEISRSGEISRRYVAFYSCRSVHMCAGIGT